MDQNLFGVSGAGTAHQFWSGASAVMTAAQKIESVYAKLDTLGLGHVTRSQFEQQFEQFNPPAAFKQMGAAAIFSRIDPAGTGSVSHQNFVQGIVAMMGEVRQQRVERVNRNEKKAAAPARTIGESLDALSEVLDQASGGEDDGEAIRASI